MALDLAILKDIDFTNAETLIFLAVFLAIAAIILLIFFAAVAKIIKTTLRIISRIFGAEARKPKLDQKDAEWLHKQKVAQGQPSAQLNASKIVVDRPVANIQEMEVPVPERFKKASTISAPGVAPKVAMEMSRPLPHEEVKNLATVKDVSKYAVKGTMGSGGGILGGAGAGEGSVSPSTDSIFKGKSEISRENLEHQLRYDKEEWQAAEQAGLNLSRSERAGFVKDIPKILGGNVSKSDLKQTVRILNRKLSDARANPEQHARLRKEIKFFKKIGGIK